MLILQHPYHRLGMGTKFAPSILCFESEKHGGERHKTFKATLLSVADIIIISFLTHLCPIYSPVISVQAFC